MSKRYWPAWIDVTSLFATLVFGMCWGTCDADKKVDAALLRGRCEEACAGDAAAYRLPIDAVPGVILDGACWCSSEGGRGKRLIEPATWPRKGRLAAP